MNDHKKLFGSERTPGQPQRALAAAESATSFSSPVAVERGRSHASTEREPTGRGVPDVCGNADPGTDYTIRVGDQEMTVGGTSAVAPLWAGRIALTNRSAARPSVI